MINNTIILPVRDDPYIAKILPEIHDIMTGVPGTYEILIVMGDKETLFPSIPSHRNQRIVTSYGDSLERAILCGFSMARGERILVLDADGSHPVQKIPEMLRSLDTHDMVIGSRYLGEFHYPLFRKFVAWCFKKYAYLFGSRLSDPMSGFFAVRKEKLKGIEFKPFTWKIGLELSMKMNSSIKEIPVDIRERQEGSSKASWKVGLKLIWDILRR